MCVSIGKGHGGRHETGSTTGLESASAFAKRGLHGLTTHRSVAFYARAWLDRFDRPRPGTKVTLPHWCGQCDADAPHDTCYPFPAFPRGSDGYDSEDGAVETIKRVTRRHPKAITRAAEEDDTVAEVTADAALDSDPVVRKVRRKQIVRDREHRDRIDEATKDLRDLNEQAREQYERTEFGTTDETVKALIRIIRDLHEAEVMWAMKGGHTSADLVNALSEIQTDVDTWRSRASGIKSTEITENDRAWADELGIDLGAVS